MNEHTTPVHRENHQDDEDAAAEMIPRWFGDCIVGWLPDSPIQKIANRTETNE